MNKYAISTPVDQTIMYWSKEGWTNSHKEARFYDSNIETIVVIETIRAFERRNGDDYFVVVVFDESEFRSRPDTWSW